MFNNKPKLYECNLGSIKDIVLSTEATNVVWEDYSDDGRCRQTINDNMCRVIAPWVIIVHAKGLGSASDQPQAASKSLVGLADLKSH